MLGYFNAAADEHAVIFTQNAAAFVPTNRLDLAVVKPEFVTVSWYKMFGYPTGIGCLLARREALARLRRPWFSGGAVRVSLGLVSSVDDVERFLDFAERTYRDRESRRDGLAPRLRC